MAKFDDAIGLILEHEGSTFTETPGDNGGATKFGITIPTLNDYNGHNNGPNDIRNLSLKDAKAVYLQQFWNPMYLSAVHDQKLATILLDQAVLTGKRRATTTLQKIVGTMPDGVMGPQTAAACNGLNSANLILDILSAQLIYYTSIVQNNPSQIKFLKGWHNRVVSLYNYAFKIV